MAKVFTKQITSQAMRTTVAEEMVIVREKLKSRSKMELILKSKALKELPVHVGDCVEIHQKSQHEKRGKSSNPKPILSLNYEGRSVMVLGKNIKVLTVSIDNLRPATPEKNPAQTVQ